MRHVIGDGLKQAEVTGNYIASESCPTLVVSSPYLRCIQTAGRIAMAAQQKRQQLMEENPKCNLPEVEFMVDPSLSEWCNPRTFGTLTPGPLMSYTDLLKTNPELSFIKPFNNCYGASPIQNSMPRWVEDVMALQERCNKVGTWVSDPHNALVRKHGSIVFVTHGFHVVMLGFVLDPTVQWHKLPSPYCCVSHLTTDRLFCSCCNCAKQDEMLRRQSHRSMWKTVLACSVDHLAKPVVEEERVPTVSDYE